MVDGASAGVPQGRPPLQDDRSKHTRSLLDIFRMPRVEPHCLWLLLACLYLPSPSLDRLWHAGIPRSFP